MIAASGMLTLHSILHQIDSTTRSPYLAAALRLVRATINHCSTPLARFVPGTSPLKVDLGKDEWDTILNQSTINYNEHAQRRWADHGLVYADFYFLEVSTIQS